MKTSDAGEMANVRQIVVSSAMGSLYRVKRQPGLLCPPTAISVANIHLVIPLGVSLEHTF